MAESASPEGVKTAIINEIALVMGLRRFPWAPRLLEPLFRRPVRSLTEMLVELDREVASLGWSQAAARFLSRFVENFQSIQQAALPQDGPLLVLSNHPGAYDVLLLAASLQRDDLKIISSEISIFRHLPSVAPHFITIGEDAHRRMAAFRAALRHLVEGHAVLIFPRGNVEADPALSARATAGLKNWSASIELFLRSAPATQTVIARVSGVIAARWLNHPIPRLWQRWPEQRQKIAEIFQVAEQLLRGHRLPLTPRVSFSQPLNFASAGLPSGKLMDALLAAAENHLVSISSHAPND